MKQTLLLNLFQNDHTFWPGILQIKLHVTFLESGFTSSDLYLHVKQP